MRSGPIPTELTRRTFLRAGATGAAWALLGRRARGDGTPELEPHLDAVPGAVLHHSPASSRLYVGSPSLAILDDGSYVASCDEFGPGGRGRPSTTYVYRSSDRGRSWERVSKVQPAGVGTLFVHAGSLYLMGTLGGIRPLVIRRSDDGGRTWTEPTDGRSGLLREGRYSTAPVPVLEHDGRLWRAVELGHTARWPSGFRASVLSAPVDADLLHAGCWRQSEPLASRSGWLDGSFRGWLEGNVCVAPDGELVNLLRADVHPGGGHAALTTVSPDGKSLRFDPETGFVDFPGGSKKFTVRWDEPSEAYWSLTNWIPKRYAGANPNRTRNTLALVCSRDLRSWTVRAVALHHPDRRHHGFQYADWRVDGDDLVWVSRTAYDDGLGGAHDQHDANLLTFHRMSGFRHRRGAAALRRP